MSDDPMSGFLAGLLIIGLVFGVIGGWPKIAASYECWGQPDPCFYNHLAERYGGPEAYRRAVEEFKKEHP